VCSGMAFLLAELDQVLAVLVLGEFLCLFQQHVGADPAVAPRDLFGRGDLEALAVLDGLHEQAGFQHAFVCAGVEPREAAPHELHVEQALVEVCAVDVGDLEFAARGGFDAAGDVDDALVVEVQAGDRVVGFRFGGLLLDGEGLTGVVEVDDAVAFRVAHLVREHGGALGAAVGVLHQVGEVVAVEDVVAQHEGAGVLGDEVLTDQEGLREAVWFGLHGVLQADAPL